MSSNWWWREPSSEGKCLRKHLQPHSCQTSMWGFTTANRAVSQRKHELGPRQAQMNLSWTPWYFLPGEAQGILYHHPKHTRIHIRTPTEDKADPANDSTR